MREQLLKTKYVTIKLIYKKALIYWIKISMLNIREYNLENK